MTNRYSAIICEGAAEQAIVDILLEHNCLIVDKKYLIEHGPIRIRSAREFSDKYLGKDFGEKIDIYRILDSRREKFNIGNKKQKAIFENKINVINVITPPEIELLIIVDKDKYVDFDKSRISKPSDYCKQKLKITRVKEYQYVKDYFCDLTRLIAAIKKVHQIKHKNVPKGYKTLYELLKDEYK